MTTHSPDYTVSYFQLEGRRFTLNMAAAVLGSWVGPNAGLERCWKSRTHRDSIPGPSST